MINQNMYIIQCTLHNTLYNRLKNDNLNHYQNISKEGLRHFNSTQQNSNIKSNLTENAGKLNFFLRVEKNTCSELQNDVQHINENENHSKVNNEYKRKMCFV
ncbi:hypothetical protein A3Q56_02693 [Intoshia linei]|uniref:Uncharacterized protein n=1 Tax=Intoshia linei TaxID=1819745 RepID=A0A177B798_9BILA|nr:hypothetical protein A3Q56_02693 [Intoshia linei]